jgi:PAS domain S-box-containing protein
MSETPLLPPAARLRELANRNRRTYVITCIAIAVTYALGARLGWELVNPRIDTAPLWPPSGFAVTAVLVLGRRYLPAVALGSVIADTWAGSPLTNVLCGVAASTGEALTFSLIAGAFQLRHSLARTRDVVVIAGAAAAGALVNATIGMASILLPGWITWSGVPTSASMWFLAEFTSVLIVTPLLISFERGKGGRAAEVLGVMALVVALSGASITFDQPELLLPGVIWAALRFGPRGAVSASLFASTATILFAKRLFGDHDTTDMLSTQAFIAVTAVTNLFFATVTAQLRSSTEERERLRLSEQAVKKLAAIVEQSPAAIIRADTDMRVDSWNAAAERLFGYTAEEMMGNPVSKITPPERKLEVLTHVDKLLAGDSIQVETERMTKTGERVPLAMTISPLRGDDGEILGAASWSTDLTATLRAREEREQLEERLHQSQRLETVGQLAGGIAHDFNNLLAVILNCTDFVRDGLPEDSDVREDVEEITRAAERAATLTKQLLVFSRRDTVRPDVLDVNHVVEDAQTLLARTLGEDVELSVRLGESLGPIYADRGKMEQVLMNLVVNARDAMPDGGSLTIETAALELDSGPHVRLEVADTGRGMPPEVVEKAFEPFFTTKEKGRGTGLGLATVYGIVTEAGGHIAIRSEEGRGTAFAIHLPVVSADDAYLEGLEQEAQV